MSEVIDRRISFNAGEISPWLDPRIDLEKYHSAARQLENLRPSIYGGAHKRAGTEYLGTALTASTAVRLIPFLGGNGTDYLLEFSNLKLRIWNADSTPPALVASVADAAWTTATAYTVGQVLSQAGSNYEVLTAHTSGTFATDLAANRLRLYPYIQVTTPFTAAQLNALQYAQQNDVMYFSHPSHTPQVLLRRSATDWVLGNAKFEWPVTMGPNASRTSILPWANAYVDDYDAGVTYVAGNHCLSSGIVYKALRTTINDTPASSASDWGVTTWSNAKAYTAGDVILYSGQYYVARSTHTAATGTEPNTTAGETFYAKANRINAVGLPDSPSAPAAYSSAVYYTVGQQVTFQSSTYVRTPELSGKVKGVAPKGDGFSESFWEKTNGAVAAIQYSIPKGESITLEASENLFQSGHVGSLWVIGHRRPDTREYFDANVQAAGYTSDPLYVLGAWTASTTKETVSNSTVVIHIERSVDLVTWEFYATVTSLPVANNQILTGTEDEPAFLRLKLVSKANLGNALTVDLQAENGMQYGLATVTAYTSATQVTATVVTPIYSYERTTRWEEPAFTSVRGFPRAVTLHDGRLWFGGITAKPTTMWGSTVDAYWDFRLGTDADRALSYTVATDESSTIEWLVSQDLLCIGTSSSEWVLGQRPGDDEIRLRRNTSFGSAAVQGRAIGDALVYLQKSRRKVREFAFSFESDKFLSNDLNMLAEHLGDAEMLQIAIQRNPESVIWVVTTRGDLLALTYERGQNVAGWCRITTQGTFESVAVVPGEQEEDHIWVVAVRNINGSTVRYIERIAPDMTRALKDGEENELIFSDAAIILNPEGTATGAVHISGNLTNGTTAIPFPVLEYYSNGVGDIRYGAGIVGDNLVQYQLYKDEFSGVWTLVYYATELISYEWLGSGSGQTYPDDVPSWAAVSPATGTPEILRAGSTISGLSHLEGETVTVLADGAKHPDCTVASGEITLNYPARTAVVGLEYDAIIEPTYLESRQVAEFSKVGKKRIHSATMEFWKSAGCEISADGGTTWTPLETRTPLDRMDSNRTLFTGLREEKLDGRTDRQNSVILRSTAPLPLNLLSMNIRYNLNTTT